MEPSEQEDMSRRGFLRVLAGRDAKPENTPRIGLLERIAELEARLVEVERRLSGRS